MKIFKVLGQIVLTTMLVCFIAPFWVAGFFWSTAKLNFEISSRMTRQTWLTILEKKV
jgi:hypothetical protein